MKKRENAEEKRKLEEEGKNINGENKKNTELKNRKSISKEKEELSPSR